MKFFRKANLNRLLVFLGLAVLSAYFPMKALALSNDTQQHFTPASTSHWVVTSGGNGYALHLGSTNSDPSDVSAQNAELYSGAPTNTGVTVTYTDPAAATPQNFLKLDIYTASEPQQVEIIATDGTNSVTALAGSDDIITGSPGCLSSSPVTANQTDSGPSAWDTVFIDTSSLGAITSAEFIIQDTNSNIGQFTGTIYLDNLRGDPILSCFTPTNTPTNTPTITPGGPTLTPTNTPTNSPTSTATNTPTNTTTPTSTPTNASPTPTSTNTPTNTQTPTVTNTPTITLTPTVTVSPTPPPAQVEVYPNPIDFTASGATINATCPTGRCMVFSGLPLNATLKIYTISLSLVRTFPQGSVTAAGNIQSGYGYIAWDGTNGNAAAVASGLYFYVVNAPGVNTFGKFAISKSTAGP